jgi:uncharacterized protein (TIGR03492 family)
MRTWPGVPDEAPGRLTNSARTMTSRVGSAEDASIAAPRVTRGAEPRVLLLSNGHGEDAIAARIARALGELDVRCIQAWPMVGSGGAYAGAGIDTIGVRNELPSEGFATLSLPLFVRDLRAGWIGTHRRQLAYAMAQRGQHDVAIAVGDIVPIVAATLSRTPYFFVGCAKSTYYGRAGSYTWLERTLLRRRAVVCYPRDALTATSLGTAGVPVRYVGNPMMDGLEPSGTVDLGDSVVIACLPGSRSDAATNAAHILALVGRARQQWASLGPVHFAFAVAPTFDVDAFARALAMGNSEWRVSLSSSDVRSACSARAQLSETLSAAVYVDHLGDVMHNARVAIGLAGTANEQAIGLGVPVVTFATDGVQGRAYLRMKTRYYGDAVQLVEPTGEAIARAAVGLSTDGPLRQRAILAGRERMGAPGASATIARDVLSWWTRGTW